MRKFIIFFLSLFSFINLQAQSTYKIQSGKAFYYSVKSGVNSSAIQIDGTLEHNKLIAHTVVLIYLISNCAQTPLIYSINTQPTNLKMEFVQIKSNEDEAGFDEQGKLQIVKAPKGTFLWKSNLSLENESSYIGKNKTILKGTLCGKKFTTTILSQKKLRALPMY